jgi:hypothetical protein
MNLTLKRLVDSVHPLIKDIVLKQFNQEEQIKELEFKVDEQDNFLNSKKIIKTVDALSELRVVDISEIQDKEIFFVKSYYSEEEGGGGLFMWDESSIEDDDNGIIIEITGLAIGRWKRIYDGAINVDWFGARGDGKTNDSSVVNGILTNYTSYPTIEFSGNKTYLVEFEVKNNNTTIFLNSGTILQKVNTNQTAIITAVSKNNLIIQGNGLNSILDGELKATAGESGLIDIQTCADVQIKNINIKNFQSFIRFVGCEKVLINGVVASGATQNGIRFDYLASPATPTSKVIIENCIVTSSNADAFNFYLNTFDVVISNCIADYSGVSITNSTKYGFVGYTGPAARVSLSNCIVIGPDSVSGGNLFVGFSIPFLSDVVGNAGISNTSLSNCHVIDTQGNLIFYGIEVVGGGAQIVNCTATDCQFGIVNIVTNEVNSLEIIESVISNCTAKGCTVGVRIDELSIPSGSPNTFVMVNNCKIIDCGTSVQSNKNSSFSNCLFYCTQNATADMGFNSEDAIISIDNCKFISDDLKIATLNNINGQAIIKNNFFDFNGVAGTAIRTQAVASVAGTIIEGNYFANNGVAAVAINTQTTSSGETCIIGKNNYGTNWSILTKIEDIVDESNAASVASAASPGTSLISAGTFVVTDPIGSNDVLLPNAVAGSNIVIINRTGIALNVNAQATQDIIDNTGTNATVAIGSGTVQKFTCVLAGSWFRWNH